MPQNVAALSLSHSSSLSVFLSGLQVNYICCIRATSVDCVGACTFCGTGCCSFSAVQLLCCFVAFYLNATTEQREREKETRGGELRVHKTIYFGFHAHTHTYSLPQQCGSHSSVKQCAVKIFTRINDSSTACVCMCVAHIKCINSNFNFNYEYFSSSMSGREGKGRQHQRDLHSVRSLARAS